MRLKPFGRMPVGVLFIITCICSLANVHAAIDDPADAAALSAATCPIVYPVDQSPSDRGYHYLFYGDGFFINEQGYLLTAAHVLSQLHGGQPYILLHDASGRPQFVRAELAIVDRIHDVAILRATPNPFDRLHTVRFLPLASDWVVRSQNVLVQSLLPAKPRDAYTIDGAVDDRSSGEVFDFRFSQLVKGRSDTELFLFNRKVLLGQSGAPVVSAKSHEVVGLIEGQWLQPAAASIAAAADQAVPGVGAAVPVHYAIALLKQKEIPWHTVSGNLNSLSGPAEQPGRFAARSAFARGLFLSISSDFRRRSRPGFPDRQSRKTHRNKGSSRSVSFSRKSACRSADLEFLPCHARQSFGLGTNWNNFSIFSVARTREVGASARVR